MGRSANKIREIAESSTDPREALQKAIGKQVDEVLHNGVLVATYIRPAMTKGGILMADQTLQEDVYQGSVGLVIALGPAAFVDDRIAQFHGVKLAVGDWVLFRPADGLSMEINQVPCRLFQDTNIMMRVTRPEIYW